MAGPYNSVQFREYGREDMCTPGRWPCLRERSAWPGDRVEELVDRGNHAAKHGNRLADRARNLHAVVGVADLQQVRRQLTSLGTVPHRITRAAHQQHWCG